LTYPKLSYILGRWLGMVVSIYIKKTMHVQVESFFILGVDFYFNIGYNGNMSNEQKERKMKPQTKKILKVLLRKAKGLNRLDKIEKMDEGLFALNLIVMRQKRDQGLSICSYETIDFIDNLLKKAKQSRLNPRTVFKQLEFNY
jgi:hypothetical protein